MTSEAGSNLTLSAGRLAEASGLSEFTRPPETMWRMFWRRFLRHKPAMISLAVLLVLTAASFGASLFVSEDAANRIEVTLMRTPPTLAHPFGMDDVGRDIFLRSLFGGQISLRIGILAALISMTIGVTVGTVAGYNTGWIDNVLMRFTDALLSIPTLFILIVLTRVLAGRFGVGNVALITVVIGALSWMRVSRIVRANVLSLKEQDFVLAARALGVRSGRILLRYIVPNTLAPIVVAATLGVGRAIIFEASLSFLGLGVQPPTATWGSMLNRAQAYLVTAPWIAIFPGLLILITVLCVNFVGDGLRDAFDPRSLR
ncbi:ABC transporter permease [Chloroflexi bacterium TSY]|nr:ABC transporter permease [Chloroflexi bacterium TSY]